MQVKKALTPLLIAISTLLISTSCGLFGKCKKKTDKESLRKHETGLSDINLGKKHETGSSDISLGKKHETSLSDIITKRDLGTIETSDRSGTPSKKEVENRLKELFPNLILDGLEICIESVFGRKFGRKIVSVFEGNSGYKPGCVELTYTTPTKRLSDIITKRDLGEINPCGRLLEEEIKNLLQKLCKLEPEAIHVFTHENYPGYAMIMPNIFYGDYYLAKPFEVILTYTIPKTHHSRDSDKTTFNSSEVDGAYKTLGIPKGTSYKEARKIYNKLVLETHPDKKQQELGQALTDEEKKHYNAAFDKVKKAWDVIESTLVRDAFSEYCAKNPKKKDSKRSSIFSLRGK